MKQLICEMCGSTDLMKQDGVFVCQSCGCKYSVEEAKKILVEGIVDVTGSTVKVDTTDELSNLYQLARRAKNDNNIENAAKYYDMILVKEPTSWEASFYSVYYHALNCKIYQITTMVNSINNCLDGVFSLICEHVKKDNSVACAEVATNVIAAAEVFFDSSLNMYKKNNSAADSMKEVYERTSACLGLLMNLGNKLDLLQIALNDEKLKSVALSAWKKANTFTYVLWMSLDNKSQAKLFDSLKNICVSFNSQILGYEPDYQDPFANVVKPTVSTPSGGCYVATTVYGSYDCPQVWTLRRYRDYTLAETWYGCAFIRTYYAISPTLVKWFGHTEWFKKIWKVNLDRMVADLNANGVENTPYEDKVW